MVILSLNHQKMENLINTDACKDYEIIEIYSPTTKRHLKLAKLLTEECENSESSTESTDTKLSIDEKIEPVNEEDNLKENE